QKRRSREENRYIARLELYKRIVALQEKQQQEKKKVAAKIRRQKRKRTTLQKQALVSYKRHVSAKKQLRKAPKNEEGKVLVAARITAVLFVSIKSSHIANSRLRWS